MYWYLTNKTSTKWTIISSIAQNSTLKLFLCCDKPYHCNYALYFKERGKKRKKKEKPRYFLNLQFNNNNLLRVQCSIELWNNLHIIKYFTTCYPSLCTQIYSYSFNLTHHDQQ